MQKTYHCKLTGNKNKLDLLESQYKMIQVIARYYLSWIKKNKDYRKNEIHRATYKKIRTHFPNLHSKLIQTTRDKVLASVKAKKLFKVKKLVTPIVLDHQMIKVDFKDREYFSCWVTFHKISYPMEGLYSINKIRNKKIKQIQIKKINNGWRIYFVCEIASRNQIIGNKVIGIDVNIKNITLSNNHRANLKKFVHKKLEYRKKKQGNKIQNYSKNFIHTLTTDLVKYLTEIGCSEIRLEDLTNIRKSSSRKLGTSKGKNLNYLLNNVFPFRMFQQFLKYKCEEVGVRVVFVNPMNTSKICSKCGSLNTNRPRQSLLECLGCNSKQNADLNGAKNIANFSINNGLPSESNQSEALETFSDKL
jgi:IS605 OrfB family transposase